MPPRVTILLDVAGRPKLVTCSEPAGVVIVQQDERNDRRLAELYRVPRGEVARPESALPCGIVGEVLQEHLVCAPAKAATKATPKHLRPVVPTVSITGEAAESFAAMCAERGLHPGTQLTKVAKTWASHQRCRAKGASDDK